VRKRLSHRHDRSKARLCQRSQRMHHVPGLPGGLPAQPGRFFTAHFPGEMETLRSGRRDALLAIGAAAAGWLCCAATGCPSASRRSCCARLVFVRPTPMWSLLRTASAVRSACAPARPAPYSRLCSTLACRECGRRCSCLALVTATIHVMPAGRFARLRPSLPDIGGETPGGYRQSLYRPGSLHRLGGSPRLRSMRRDVPVPDKASSSKRRRCGGQIIPH